MPSLYHCIICQQYTMKTICSSCNKKTLIKKPPRFSPQDHYGKYRRTLKQLQNKKNIQN